MPSSLDVVREQFPQLRDRVAALFERDEVFRELCDDYVACVQVSAGLPESEDLRSEYEALRLRMEYELLRHMQESPGLQGPGRR